MLPIRKETTMEFVTDKNHLYPTDMILYCHNKLEQNNNIYLLYILLHN